MVALCSRDAARARAAADEAGVSRAYGDWRELVADPAVHLIAVATPPSEHAGPVLAALAAGKAVLCEKPLAATLEDATALAAAAAGRTAAISFGYRALPAFVAARAAAADGAIGHVVSVDVSWHLGTRLTLPPGTGWKDDASTGGGALASYGIHMLDYSRLLLGPVQRVCCRLENRTRDGHVSDDACEILLDHAGGGRSTLDISLVSTGERRHRVVVNGERGLIVIESTLCDDHVRVFVARLEATGAPPRELPLRASPWPAPASLDGRVEPVAAIAAALLQLPGAASEAPSFADGLTAQRLLAAARTSAVSASWTAP